MRIGRKCGRIPASDVYCLTYYGSRDTFFVLIQSFRCKETEKLFHDQWVPRFQHIERQARRKLLYLHHARTLEDLARLPGNRLEALKGKRHGQYSIRINDQWRICFVWHDGEVHAVEIVDYH